MSKGRRAKKKAPFVDIYAVLILVATLIMSIAYAEIAGAELTVATKAEASAQEGVFITNVVCNEQNSVSNNYMATTLDSSITLASPTDTKTFTITIYNKTLKPHVFVGVKKLDKWDEFTGVYNNTNISYTFGDDMVPHKTILQPKTWITFNVDLGFNGQGEMPETLRSLLNFSFQEIPTLEVISEDTIENMYPNCEEKVYKFTLSNQRQDETHGLLTNGVPLTYTISPNVPAPLTAKIYDEDGTEVAANQKITISSEAKEEQTYTMKVKWDNTNPENGKEYNSAEYAGQTLASTIKIIATPDIIDDNDKYIGYTLNKEEPVEIKTEPLYFGVTTDKTTVEMNNTIDAESILLTIKNNDGTEKINSFPVEYKLSIGNSKFKLFVYGSELGDEILTLGNTATISQEHNIQLVSVAEIELEKEEKCNLTIQAISPYEKTETIALEIKDTKGPTAPAIEGGNTSTTYATSKTISVSEVATDVGTGIDKYQYLLNSTESTETESIEVADVTTTEASQLFTEDAPGYYVYFRAVDNAGNPGEWSNAQQIYIDTAEPIVGLASGVSSEMTIEEGESHLMTELFTYDKNGNAGVKSVTYTVNGTPIANTSELTASDTPYTIICTVTKDTNVSKTASITIIVEALKIATDGSWNGKVNNPLLMNGMTAVYWSTDGGATPSTTQEGATPIYSKVGGKSTGADNPNFVWKNWYEYVAGDNATDTKTSRWANAVTNDGSYWVWVPRYKYLISDKPTEAGNDKAGKIDIKFIPTTDKKGASGYTTTANSEGEILTKDSSGYIIHPAFENGSSSGKNNGYANGEWDSELPGFWVAKYEMSMEDANGNNVNTSSADIGNVKISSNAKMVSKPGVTSWRNIQIGQIYQNCLLYEPDKGSHMMKNSEWGATAYITHSQYGRNRNEITPNDSSGYYTGNAGDSPTDSSAQETIGHAYNTTSGMLASTTGNIYGVYDMSGGAWENTANWDTKSTSSYISNYGKAVDGIAYFTSGGTSDKYKTAYSNGTDTNYGENVKTVCRTGDGIKETWVNGGRSWFNDYADFLYSDKPISIRGGYHRSENGDGVFYSSYGFGGMNMGSFRAVLAEGVETEPVTIATDGSWNGKVNNPLLMSGMTAVYWSTDGGATASTTQEGATPIYSKIGGKSTGADNPAFNWNNWYKYTSGDNATDTKTSRWANAVTDDGSYWVWVPRYKYLISDQPTEAGDTNAGKIDIKFIPTTDKKGTTGYTTTANSEGEILTKDSSGYIIHPAFENGSSTGKNNGYANGEWSSELPGFWVAKYEMSMEDASGANVNTSSSSIGNVKISETAKMVSKPGVQSWRNIQIGQIYQNCLLYDAAKGSHLIKNSEWGATAYLTHSQYGRNRNEITINDSSGYYTGNAGDSPTDSSTQSGISHAYNTKPGMLASTTGNIYGVYDMSGGAWEYTAGWNTKSTSSYITSFGKAVDGTVYFTSGGNSDKYKTAYSNGTSTFDGETVKTVCRTGDGIKETWVSGYNLWFADCAHCVSLEYPASVRGGAASYSNQSGIFTDVTYQVWGDSGGGRTYRAVLAGSVDVEPVSGTLEITVGESNNTFASLFTVTTADGENATKTYTLNGELASATNNTSVLPVGTHTITCTATYNGMSDTAYTTIVVKSAVPTGEWLNDYSADATFQAPENVTQVSINLEDCETGEFISIICTCTPGKVYNVDYEDRSMSARVVITNGGPTYLVIGSWEMEVGSWNGNGPGTESIVFLSISWSPEINAMEATDTLD